MESYLKHYKMKLKTLAPLYIGSGKEVTRNNTYLRIIRYMWLMYRNS